MSEFAVAVKNMSFKVGSKQILNDITFDVPKGCVYGVVGHNGAGKTTLFHLLLGLKFQTTGEISLFGRSNFDFNSRLNLGYVPERPYINLEFTLYNFLNFHANLAGITSNKKQGMIQAAASSVGLGSNLHQELGTFSKGMLQKSLLAQAVLGDPDFLILDEPMSGLDPEARESVRQQIVALKEKGKTLIFSSHAHDDVAQLADRVLAIKAGRVDFVGTVKDWEASRN